jgi:hypothetical protein
LRRATSTSFPVFVWDAEQWPDFGGENLSQFIANSGSSALSDLKDFITDFITRYVGGGRIRFYEVSHGLNKLADIASGSTRQFTTTQLKLFGQRVVTHIKTLDASAKVGSGYFMPASYAYHLSVTNDFTSNGDFTSDTSSQLKTHLKSIHEPYDIVSTSYFRDDNDRFGLPESSATLLDFVKEAADEAGKDVSVSSFGDRPQDDASLKFAKNVMAKIDELDLPYSAIWAWEYFPKNVITQDDFSIDSDNDDSGLATLVTRFNGADTSLGNGLHYKVEFYGDHELTKLLFTAFSLNDQSGWTVNGEAFTAGGVAKTLSNPVVSYVPQPESLLTCNQTYYVRVFAYEVASDQYTLLSDNHAFASTCNATFVDDVSFDYTALETEFHQFRVRLYNDPERTDLVRTYYTGTNVKGWSVGGEDFPTSGVEFAVGETARSASTRPRPTWRWTRFTT